MKAHDSLDEEAGNRAALYVLGALSDDEIDEYDQHILVCSACHEEVASLRTVVADLSSIGPRVEPPAALKARLFERITGTTREPAPPAASAQPWRSWATEAGPSGLSFNLASEAAWEPAGQEGVEVRRLFVDQSRERVTMLVKMTPGTAYPRHRHGGAEECYVVSGDLRVGDRRMVAGDYQHAAHGSIHGVQSTEGGCLLLVVSSMHDEILPGNQS